MCKLLVLLVAASGALSAAGNLTILPNTIELNGPEARHHLLAEAALGDHQEDWTRKAEWRSSNPKIAILAASGGGRPTAHGAATITPAPPRPTAPATGRVQKTQNPPTHHFRTTTTPPVPT